MRVLSFYAENFKKLRVVEIRRNGRVTMITGGNGEGKSSVLDGIWFALKGIKALPLKPIRRGTERMKVQLETDEFIVTRTLSTKDGVLPNLNLEMAKGHSRELTPQKFLDNVMSAITFDPLEFLAMSIDDQVAMLRKVAGVTLDFGELDQANEADYKERALINRDVAGLEARFKAMTVLEGLPKEKLDEAAIMAQLDQAGEANRRAQEVFKAKQELGGKAGVARQAREANDRFLDRQSEKIAELRRQLEVAEQAHIAGMGQRAELTQIEEEAQRAYDAAPAGEPVDVSALTTELTSAQRTNRAIDQRAEWERLRTQIEAKRGVSNDLTRQMEAREEKKRLAVLDAKMPVDGLMLDARQVLYNGLPLENLGEGEQIRISLEIGMAANPNLKFMCIRHGEALDDKGLKLVAELAEKYDCDVWITKVDSSGKVGIVLEDGEVKARNEGD